jgi:hypothetical protein
VKCPKCGSKTPSSAKATCSCGYVFALNPKEEPYISDRGMKGTIDKLSSFDRHYFTFNQLYAALFKAATKKRKQDWGKAIIILMVVGTIASAFVWSNYSFLILLCLFGIGLPLFFYLRKRPTRLPHESLVSAIKKYERRHTIPMLAKGERFSGDVPKEQIQQELFSYAPQTILIVPSNDMVDMLVLNHFHIENKAAIISSSKYPQHVFSACQKMLEKHPETSVEVIHDASEAGQKLVETLKADPSWNLRDKEVKDLGLFPKDVEAMKTPIWIPGRTGPKTSLSGGKAEDNMNAGMSVPIDSVGPNIMMAALATAVVTGALLLGEELLAREAKTGDSSASSDSFG